MNIEGEKYLEQKLVRKSDKWVCIFPSKFVYQYGLNGRSKAIIKWLMQCTKCVHRGLKNL